MLQFFLVKILFSGSVSFVDFVCLFAFCLFVFWGFTCFYILLLRVFL